MTSGLITSPGHQHNASCYVSYVTKISDSTPSIPTHEIGHPDVGSGLCVSNPFLSLDDHKVDTFPPLKQATQRFPSVSIVIPSGTPVTLLDWKLNSVLLLSAEMKYILT